MSALTPKMDGLLFPPETAVLYTPCRYRLRRLVVGLLVSGSSYLREGSRMNVPFFRYSHFKNCVFKTARWGR